jgi:hypothetical protein
VFAFRLGERATWRRFRRGRLFLAGDAAHAYSPATGGGRTIRLHDLLARPGVHILLDRDADPVATLPPSRFVSVHRLASSPGRGLIAVRPDGYIGFRSQTTEIGQLATWLAWLRAGTAFECG